MLTISIDLSNSSSTVKQLNHPNVFPFSSFDALSSAVPVFPANFTPFTFKSCAVPVGLSTTCIKSSLIIFAASFEKAFFTKYSFSLFSLYSIYGFTILPSFTNAEYIDAICIGFTNNCPWPYPLSASVASLSILSELEYVDLLVSNSKSISSLNFILSSPSVNVFSPIFNAACAK